MKRLKLTVLWLLVGFMSTNAFAETYRAFGY